MAHVYTTNEILTIINDDIAAMIQTELTEPTIGSSTQQRLQGLAANILALFDGTWGEGFPLCIVATHPDEEYSATNLANGYNSFPISDLAYGDDLGGLLSNAYLESLG